jgi:hypothetical protein
MRLLVLPLWVGCGEPVSNLTVQDPCIEVSERSFRLEAAGGAADWAVLEVGNGCDAALYLSEAQIDGDPAFFVTDPPPTAIRRDQAIQLGITFEPDQRGSYTALLRIRNNDPNEPVVEIDLEGSW